MNIFNKSKKEFLVDLVAYITIGLVLSYFDFRLFLVLLIFNVLSELFTIKQNLEKLSGKLDELSDRLDKMILKL